MAVGPSSETLVWHPFLSSGGSSPADRLCHRQGSSGGPCVAGHQTCCNEEGRREGGGKGREGEGRGGEGGERGGEGMRGEGGDERGGRG